MAGIAINPVGPGETFLAGLIGAGLQASRTPIMHQREAAALGFDYRYELIDLEVLGLGVSALDGLIADAARRGFAGLNITHPCKQAAVLLVDELSAAAAAIGATNTIQLQNNRRIGHNTDCSGFATAFRAELAALPSEQVVLLGAGGAGAAVAFALLNEGVGRLYLFDIDKNISMDLARRLQDRFGPGCAIVIADLAGPLWGANGLVNATPMGMANHPGMAVPVEHLRPDLWVADIVYFPLETELLRSARRQGCRTMNGASMAVMQAAHAFRIFTGVVGDPARMQQHFEALSQF